MSHTHPSESHEPQGSNAVLRTYLLERDDIFRTLHDLREEGHRDPEADIHFGQQRKNVDNASAFIKLGLYRMMKKVATELNEKASRALEMNESWKPRITDGTAPVGILDLCMAPGGFSSVAMDLNPTAKVRGITLPPSQGGHDVFLPGIGTDRIQVDFIDITLLAGIMDVSRDDVPSDHPDIENFRYDDPFPDTDKFDLVFCDGQVLRTHKEHRQSYRNNIEGTRLLTSQLVLAFARIREGGTMVVKLHRVDRLGTAQLIYAFSRVADVQLYKPMTAWRRRGSFYLIAKNVRPTCTEALEMVTRWKTLWKRATFGLVQTGPDGDGEEMEDLFGVDVEKLLDEFGPTLIRLGRPVWKTQADALRDAPWKKKKRWV